MQNTDLPSVEAFIHSPWKKHVTFVKPQVRVWKPGVDFPVGIGGHAVRTFQMNGGQATPFHVHERRNKLYAVLRTFGTVELTMIHEGQVVNHLLSHLKPFCMVPPGCPHFLVCLPVNKPQEFCDLAVITSNHEDSDIIWEAAADELVSRVKTPGV